MRFRVDSKKWLTKYVDLREEAGALDIEREYKTQKIAVLGIAVKERMNAKYKAFVRYENLTMESVREQLKDIGVLLTFNGLACDIRYIKRELPGVIRKDMQIIDLHHIARSMGLPAGLKELEKHFGIQRRESEKITCAWKLWEAVKLRSREARQKLLDYNRADCVNLFEVADRMAKEAGVG